MKVLSITLQNPKIETKRINISNDGIINKNIEEMLLDIKKVPKETSAARKIIKRDYAIDDDILEEIEFPYNWQSYVKIEERLASFDKCILVSLPSITSTVFAIYKTPLNKPKEIPSLHYIDDYIDLLYSLYSYLLF